MDGMLRCALPGRTVLTLAASVLFTPLVREPHLDAVHRREPARCVEGAASGTP